MIGKLTYTVLHHRPVVVVVLAIFIALGINSYVQLPVEAYPDVTNVSVQIITLFPGHAAEEVERLVTIPIESVMNGIPKRVSMRSISVFGLSQITLVFDDDANNATIRNLAYQLLATVTLPAGAQPGLSPDATPIGEVYRYTLRAAPGFPDVEVRALEDWVVEKKFRAVPGVVDVNPFGGQTKQYQVLVDPAKLKSYNLSLQQVFTALANGNNNAGGSYVEHGSELYVVRGLGFVRNVADIEAIAVDTPRRHPHPHQRHRHGRHRQRRPPGPGRQDRSRGRQSRTRRGRCGRGHRHHAPRRKPAGGVPTASRRRPRRSTPLSAARRQAGRRITTAPS